MTSLPDFLFPIPSSPPSKLSPPHWPGVSPQSTESLLKVLKDNHERWHTFFNDKHFHNHAPHRSLALWALGADGDIIEAGYKKDCGYERPAFKSPEPINNVNFNDHLGDERFYQAYLDFFTQNIQKHGIGPTLDEFIFSPKANLGSGKGTPEDKQPRMLSRFFSGVLHPLIHTGYGAEFGLPGMVAEGLGQCAVHSAAIAALVPASLFDESALELLGLGTVAAEAGQALSNAFNNTVQAFDSGLDAMLPKALHTEDKVLTQKTRDTSQEGNDQKTDASKPPQAQNGISESTHALDILARVAKDPRFAPSPTDENSFDASIGKHAPELLKYADQWTLDVHGLQICNGELERKIEELAWVVCVMYGVGGWTGRGKTSGGKDAIFNADFFLMHLLTSSLFLPSITAHIKPLSQFRLLKIYFVTALAMFVFRGRPALDIVGFQTFHEHTPPDNAPSPQDPEAVNPWFSIIQTVIVHPDEHLTKAQRALAGWAASFGTHTFENQGLAGFTKKGGEEAAGLGMGWGAESIQPHDTRHGSGASVILRELSGAEYLDGTLFLRTAALTAARMGKVREDDKEGEFWDFKGFYDQAESQKSHL